MAESLTIEERVPAPPELVAMAEAAVREFDVKCFWFWDPDAKIRYVTEVRSVVKGLRRYGNRRAWRAAQDLQRCL